MSRNVVRRPHIRTQSAARVEAQIPVCNEVGFFTGTCRHFIGSIG